MMSIFQHNENNLEKIDLRDITLYRSIFKYLNSNMYILVENNQVLVIDPNPCEKIISFLKKKPISKVKVLLTHEHRDHVYGLYLFQQNFSTEVIATKPCAEYISKKENARPIIICYMLEEFDRQNGTNILEEFKKSYVPCTYSADITFEETYSMDWCSHKLELFKAIGHSKGSCGIIFDNKIVFTGDSLMKDLPVITRFPGGSRSAYINETLPMLEKKLKPDMWILPGHGNPFELNEIMKDGKINVEFR